MSLRRFFLISAMAILLGSTSVGAIYLYNFDLNSFRSELEDLISERISKPFTLGNAHLSIKHGPAFAFDNVSIGTADEDLQINVEKVFFRLKTLPLLTGDIQFSELLFENPAVSFRLRKRQDEQAGFIPEKKIFTGEFIQSLRVNNGTFIITDLRTRGKEETFSIENIYLNLNDINTRYTGRIKTKGTLVHRGIRSPFELEGQYAPSEGIVNWEEDFYRFDLNAKHISAAILSPWLQQVNSDLNMHGFADMSLKLEGRPHEGVTITTHLNGKKLNLLPSSTEATPIAITRANLTGRIQYVEKEISLEDTSLTLESTRGRLEVQNRVRLTLNRGTVTRITSEGQLTARLATDDTPTDSHFFSRNFSSTYTLDLSRTKSGWKASNGNFTLPGIALNFNGQWRDDKDKPFAFSIKVPGASLASVTALMPGLSRLKLSGNFDAHLNLEGSKNSPVQTVGTLNLSDAGLVIPGQLADLDKLNGRFNLDGVSVRAKGVRANLGNSPISVDLNIPDLTNPDVTMHVLSDAIRADELIFTSDTQYLKQVDGIVRLADNTVFLGPIHVKMDGGTDATVNGSVRNFTEPEVYLDIKGRHGNIDEIIALWENNHAGPVEPGPEHKVHLKIDIVTESGQISGMPFDQATSPIVIRDKALIIGPIRFRGGEGEGVGQVILIQQNDGSSLLKISGNVENFDAQAVYHQLLKRQGLVSGKLSGDFYLEGIAGKQFLPTSLGAFSMQIDDGRLYKLTGLAKVLHFLNLYPLLTENVKGKGLPYETITFNSDLFRGVLATDDFLMHGDIMNLSMTGDYNIIENTVNFDMAAMPLRTVDSVLSHIPIAGWLLTGSKKALVVAHFEMTGNADDPDVKSVPLESVTEPVLGILKRVFTIPVKIITDPEQVLINQ